ncbi:MAG: repair protein RecO [Candidatus Saccharibacteria bacterium]|nr:repair protein RecO [Candidatus Saccharibacteria bacterium]
MNHIQTKGIILSRTDYGEADKIITLLTPDHGKLRMMARGVRRIKSKSAGGIELFSVSDISYIKGRGELGTLVSARLLRHYGDIVKDVNRTMLGYDLIKQLHRATEDEPEPEYFDLLERAFISLNNPDISLDLIRVWFEGQLIKLGGHTPNLFTDINGEKLSPDQTYSFDYDAMAFDASETGSLGANHIKCLRLCFGVNDPQILHQVQGITAILPELATIIKTALNTFIRV